MSSAKPTREQADLADVLELILDKGIVINADIVITVGETELIGIELRAAIASFETAAEYGLAFPSGTDMRRVEQASGRPPLDEESEADLGIEASEGGESAGATRDQPTRRPDPSVPLSEEGNKTEGAETEGGNDGTGEIDPDEVGEDDSDEVGEGDSDATDGTDAETTDDSEDTDESESGNS